MRFACKFTYFQVTKYSSQTICLNEGGFGKKSEIHGGIFKLLMTEKRISHVTAQM